MICSALVIVHPHELHHVAPHGRTIPQHEVDDSAQFGGILVRRTGANTTTRLRWRRSRAASSRHARVASARSGKPQPKSVNAITGVPAAECVGCQVPLRRSGPAPRRIVGEVADRQRRAGSRDDRRVPAGPPGTVASTDRRPPALALQAPTTARASAAVPSRRKRASSRVTSSTSISSVAVATEVARRSSSAPSRVVKSPSKTGAGSRARRWTASGRWVA